MARFAEHRAPFADLDDTGETEQAIHDAGGKALGVTADVSDPDSVKALIKWIGNSKHEDDLVLQRVDF